MPSQAPERMQRVGEYLRRRRRFRTVQARTAKDLLPYAQPVFNLINLAYRDLYGVTELTREQIDDCVRQYFPNVVPDFVKVALDRDERVAGFIIAMPSLSHALQKARGHLFPFGFLHLLRALKKPKAIDFYLGAVRPDVQGLGVETLMSLEIYEACARWGITSAESNIHLETNSKIQAMWKLLPHRQHKRRRCFIKPLV
jgi:GNAT superfamily N-acetyltransferase